VINLSPTAEPEIHATITRFGTVLENVIVDPVLRLPDVDDNRLTENTRACYPLDFIPNASETGLGPHPQNVVMLTCDAFGVMPPDRPAQRRAGDVSLPVGLYRPCRRQPKSGSAGSRRRRFRPASGAPFMPRRPTEYAKMLGDRIGRFGAKCWLVNTGWSGGAYGTGKRMAIAHTRNLLRAVLDGRLAGAPMRKDENFGFLVPESCADVPADVLDPARPGRTRRPMTRPLAA